jgi:tetratricopeptide (TPR) repeat protein
MAGLRDRVTCRGCGKEVVRTGGERPYECPYCGWRFFLVEWETKEDVEALANTLKAAQSIDESVQEGNAFFGQGKFEQAIKCFDKAISIGATDYVPWQNKGSALAQLDRTAEAMTCYDKAIEISTAASGKPDVDTLCMKAGLLQLQHRTAEAHACLERARALDPKNARVKMLGDAFGLQKGRVGLVERQPKEDAGALADTSKVAQSIQEGNAFFEQHKFEQAVNCYDKAIEISTVASGKPDVKALCLKAGTLWLQTKTAEAHACLEQARALDPKNAEVKRLWDAFDLPKRRFGLFRR